MKKKVASGMMVTLLLVSVVTLTFNIQPIRAESRTWTVDDDLQEYPDADFSKIQDAVDVAHAGDTIIVYPGTYLEDGSDRSIDGYCIAMEVDKSLTIKSESGPDSTVVEAINFDRPEEPIDYFHVTVDHVTIIGFTIRRVAGDYYYYGGIILDGANHCEITDNVILDADLGIGLHSSSNNMIVDNYLWNEDIGDNVGIGLWASSNNVINNNIFENNGVVVSSSYNNVVQNNLVNGKPLVYLENVSDYIITDAGQIILVNCVNITVKYLNLSNGFVGIELWGTNSSEISDNTILTNTWGILLEASNDNRIGNNDILNNIDGILLYSSSNNKIIENNISNIRDHFQLGLESSNNEIIGNNISINSEAMWELGTNNRIYLNNFVISELLIFFPSVVSSAMWNSPEKITYTYNGRTYINYLGNNWSNYTGVDADGDGIGDTSYIIDENNQDNYPLMTPWSPAPPVMPATIDIDPDTLNLKSQGKWITAYIELPEGNNVSDIDISSILLNNTVSVDLDAPAEIGDYDEDGILEHMVKFDRAEAMALLSVGEAILTITGEVDGTPFEGSDTIRVR